VSSRKGDVLCPPACGMARFNPERPVVKGMVVSTSGVFHWTCLVVGNGSIEGIDFCDKK